MSKRANLRVHDSAVDCYRPLLADLAEFNAGDNLKGRWYPTGAEHMLSDRDNLGELPEHYRQEFRGAARSVDYIVWSYATPIAWHARLSGGDREGSGYRGVWVIPHVRYSQTTSKHQAIISRACRWVNAAGKSFYIPASGPFVNLMLGRRHRGITPGWQSGGTAEDRGVATLPTAASPWGEEGQRRTRERVQPVRVPAPPEPSGRDYVRDEIPDMSYVVSQVPDSLIYSTEALILRGTRPVGNAPLSDDQADSLIS